MAGQIDERVKTHRRYEWVLPSPATTSDLLLAIHWARQKHMDLNGSDQTWDDVPMIEASDDEIILYFDHIDD